MNKLEEEIYFLKKELEKYKHININEIKELIEISNDMKCLLEECLSYQLDYKLAKRITTIVDYLNK